MLTRVKTGGTHVKFEVDYYRVWVWAWPIGADFEVAVSLYECPDGVVIPDQIASLNAWENPDCHTLARQVISSELNPAIFADWLDDHRECWTATGDAERVLEVLRRGW